MIDLSLAIASITYEAAHAIDCRMSAEGAKKYGPMVWLSEPEDQHLLKAISHITTYMQIRDGLKPADGEDHLQAAVCRTAMGLTVRERLNERKARTHGKATAADDPISE